jgi:hypothetical protein
MCLECRSLEFSVEVFDEMIYPRVDLDGVMLVVKG